MPVIMSSWRSTLLSIILDCLLARMSSWYVESDTRTSSAWLFERAGCLQSLRGVSELSYDDGGASAVIVGGRA